MRNMRNSYREKPRYEIRIAGSGGQGIILAGIILAEAAIHAGRHVAQSQNYGPESRGGSSVSEVIIGETEIDYPKTVALDLLVALAQEACDQNLPDMKAVGLVVVDSDLVRRVIWGRVVKLPFRRIAREAGEERAINMAALGAIASFCPLVSADSLTRVMTERLPSTKVAANQLAFETAMKAAGGVKKGLKSVDIKEEFEV